MSAGIPLADVHAFRPYAGTTRFVLAALAACAVGAAAGVLLASRASHSQTLLLLPPHANVVIVLDQSASIDAADSPRIAGTLRLLLRSRDRVGLVIFSDAAYEALPTGTPAADLLPLLRYFTLPRQTVPGIVPLYPLNPWGSTFTGGTNISLGMQTAIDMAVAQRPHPAVMLVSDLDDNPNDLPALTALGAVAQHDRVPIRIVGLNPLASNVAYFRSIFGRSARFVDAPTAAQAARQQEQTPFPWTIVALIVAAATALAVREGWAPQLRWRRSQ